MAVKKAPSMARWGRRRERGGYRQPTGWPVRRLRGRMLHRSGARPLGRRRRRRV